MKFDFDKYPGKYVMHCKTEEEAKEFCEVMYGAGRRWCNGESYLEVTAWNVNKNNTAYDFNRGKCASVEFYQYEYYTILEWSDFRKEKEMTKSELKTGMVVECRNGDKYTVLINTPMGDILVCENGWFCLQDYKDDMRNTVDGAFDIIAVYSPDDEFQMTYKCWNDQTCIWQRSKVKEVTLSEIAKKFGVAVEDIRIKDEKK